MKNNLGKCLTFSLIGLLCLNAFGQSLDTIEVHRDNEGNINFARFDVTKSIQQNETATLKAILKSGPNNEFRLIKTTGDEKKGLTHKRYQQYYKGIKVDQGEYLVHNNNGKISSVNGDFQLVNVNVTPSIQETQALEIAKSFVKAQKYKWEDENMERFIKENTNNPSASYYPKGELVITKDLLKTATKNYLAWKFTISALTPYKEELVYVDAITGDVINDINLIFDTNATGSAQTLYNAVKAITTDLQPNNTYRLYETRQNVAIHTLNLLRQENLGTYSELNDADNNWTSAEYDNQYHDITLLDAHYSAEVVFDYWKNVRKRNSINNQGMPINSYAHWGSNYNNAKWDGNNNVMMYGDGDGTNYRPLVSLDVFAHEFGHGICQFSAGLLNIAGESGAINEGFSDIWGAVIEAWAAPNKQRWLSGEDITITAPGFNRSMSNPHDGLEGRVDTYNGQFWYYGSDLGTYTHTNLGVLNHWFYLLSDGGTGWNNGQTSHAAAGNGYNWTVGSIGINDAAKLAYIAEAHYLTSTTNYSSLRLYTIAAAVDSFGVNSCQEISTTNAWYAVGVGNKFQYSNITISGPTLLCSSGTFTVSGVPSGCVVTQWNYSSNLSLYSVVGNSATFTTTNANSAGWVQPIIHSNTCNTNTEGPIYNIWCGTPQITNQKVDGTTYSPGRQLCPGNHYLTVTPIGGNFSNTSWTVPAGVTYSVGTNMLNFTFPSSYSNITITSRSANSCGTGTNASFYLSKKTSGCSGFLGMTLYPNPASENVTITLDDITTSESSYNSDLSTIEVENSEEKSLNTYTIKIYSKQGNILTSLKRTGKSFNVPLINMYDGTYIIEVTDGSNSYKQQLIVKHN